MSGLIEHSLILTSASAFSLSALLFYLKSEKNLALHRYIVQEEKSIFLLRYNWQNMIFVSGVQYNDPISDILQNDRHSKSS